MRRVLGFVLVGVLAAAGLSACDPAAKVDARAGAGQITVTTVPNALVALYDKRGNLVPTMDLTDLVHPKPVDTRRTDANGVLVMRYVPVGSGYTVRRLDSTKTAPSDPVTVHSREYEPDPATYKTQKLQPGFGYLMTRDGTLLSYTLRLPGPIDKGPYPTVVEYSGYDPSNPYDWSGTAPSMRLANAKGYAALGINLRGSGCSGGSFRVFEEAQAVDGYDIVETVAAQPWVKDHKVGLVGLSYPGLMAVLTAEQHPPSLAGIAVGGTNDDSLRFLLRPGGILNTGFARSWVAGRYAEANPATSADWVKRRIAEGDAVCKANMRLRGQSVSVLDAIDQQATLPNTPAAKRFTDTLAPSVRASKVDVPMLLIATWQDEQSGGHVPSMIPKFTGTSKKHVILTNGGHAEMFGVPEILQRWDEFLDLYVAKKVPNGSFMRNAAPYVGQQMVGTRDQLTTLPFPADRFTGMTYAQALAKFEADKQVQVLFENGAGLHGTEPGLPDPAFSTWFDTYPVPSTQATRWWLGDGGTLTDAAPTAADDAPGTIDTYVSDPSARRATSKASGGDWDQYPGYDWQPPVAGKSLTYLTPAFATDTTMVGSGSVDLWVRSSAADTDLQVTLTEVRPDGKETYVQSGWLRASDRKLDAAQSTELQPIPTFLTRDVAPMPAGQFVPMRIEIYPFGHVFRAGSKARIIITAPGGDRMAWSFQNLPGTPTNEIARSVGRPSSVVLPVVPGVSVPTGLPACPGLRAQPCRAYPPAS
ncbi:MAG: CocE/NonD family hydrolase [Acidimicrobiales bacterium]